jgi:hypothetical protein
MLFRKFGIRHSQEAHLGGTLGGGIAKAEDGLRARQFLGRIADTSGQTGQEDGRRKNYGRKESHRAPE